jgi:hypothetical protein
LPQKATRRPRLLPVRRGNRVDVSRRLGHWLAGMAGDRSLSCCRWELRDRSAGAWTWNRAPVVCRRSGDRACNQFAGQRAYLGSDERPLRLLECHGSLLRPGGNSRIVAVPPRKSLVGKGLRTPLRCWFLGDRDRHRLRGGDRAARDSYVTSAPCDADMVAADCGRPLWRRLRTRGDHFSGDWCSAACGTQSTRRGQRSRRVVARCIRHDARSSVSWRWPWAFSAVQPGCTKR